LIDGHKVRLFN